ncbi:ABC-type transport system periplasmic substrate-binding protein (plasmid) [Halobacterium hubeiense]|uniref:ABC-type transport system periplasmic substrate-binding protein n=1 Tax=Halobacterium hubeiense TaxID=1407499 RepID=A0A0U5H7C1_9EURY|nr:ABC transporter substrate-binding protein [Halobacterium hubeiense]CQH64190.1 ABC-type transport system periplasmic substrate-binding protein [Halobacterium hubeiense]
MDDDTTRYEAPTRRDYLKFGGSLVGGGLLAGCTGQTDSESPSTQTAADDTETATETTSSGSESYSVTMSPVGTVEFDSPPESAFTVLVHHADMALALGYGDAINAMYAPELFGGLYNMFLDRLDGVPVEWTDLINSWNIDKETLYELDSDVHLADPAYMTVMDSWDAADVEEVQTNISPWFGNAYSDRHGEPPEAWAKNYEYYTLWEIFEKVAAVFQREDRYQALAAIHSEIVSELESNRPAESERPRVARVQMGISDGALSIYPFNLNDPGFEQAHLRPLGVEDAFADVEGYTQVDLEALVEADPDVILATHALGPERNFDEIKSHLESDRVAQQITAVESGRVYPMAIRYGGPIANLFQLEMAAKQVYPEQFGTWPDSAGTSYPAFSVSKQLFDRQAVADIINGDF